MNPALSLTISIISVPSIPVNASMLRMIVASAGADRAVLEVSGLIEFDGL